MDPGTDEDSRDPEDNSAGDVESGGECGDFLSEFESSEKWKKVGYIRRKLKCNTSRLGITSITCPPRMSCSERKRR